MINRIMAAVAADYPELLILWEASVRASHHFLPEQQIIDLREPILQHYFPAVQLMVWRDEAGTAQGFIGVHQGNIEMLFVAPDAQGKGVGSGLLRYAVEHLQATQVDVNEQNPAALGFYQYHGFVVNSRSELDGQGNPYPLLHLALP